jgi:hypothetical protein
LGDLLAGLRGGPFGSWVPKLKIMLFFEQGRLLFGAMGSLWFQPEA